MSGWIIPAPFAIPVKRTTAPRTCAVREKSLGRVSVVMMACAASGQPSGRRAAQAAGTAASSRSMGNCTPITPVLITCTELSAAPRLRSTASAVSRVLASPSTPVHALAYPLLMITPEMPSGLNSRSRRSYRTGAAGKAFCVNVAAAWHGTRLAISATSRRRACFNPPATPAASNPGTTNSSGSISRMHPFTCAM